jgi:xanthine/CO dehydrogenase XdhC/CoxF family maturation factor
MMKSTFDVRLDTSLESLLDRLPAAGDAGVLATLVATSGSTYRKPGARMLILPDGAVVGLLSGGCLESDLGIHAAQVRASGRPRAVEYDMRGPDDLLFGIGAGCEGAMRVLLEPLVADGRAVAAMRSAARTARSGRGTALVVMHDGLAPLGTYDGDARFQPAAARAVLERTSAEVIVQDDHGRCRAFIQYLAPTPHVLICGAGPDAAPVVEAALTLGWRVTVVDHRPAYAVADRFPGAAVKCAAPRDLAVRLDEYHAAVVMSHHLASDITYLRALAGAAGPPYVGLLGPAARRQRIAAELGQTMALLGPRLHGPVGFDLGAVTPEGIALAIVAEIHASLAGRERR